MSNTAKNEGTAIVGMAGRFPKAANIDEFWRNLCGGVEGISFFSDEELAAGGVATPKDSPNYVKARGVLADADLFDAAFFGMSPKEAEMTDPQHRVFLECAWEALESAGWDPEKFEGAIGVFAGMSMNTYVAHNLLAHPELIALVGEYQVMLGNDKDFLPTRVSYKLNLKGPSLNIQTACSTSLVAVCVACQHLLDYQCDMALAGAVSISFPQKRGYLYQQGGIASPDGHCRAFDAKAAGTVAGEGAAIVVLKRLPDALADGDQIFAVIKGFATNNDGANKIGYTAPSVEGQAEVIAMAQAMAEVEPETISYIEAHGTGTPLGDPIEIEGLSKAFRATTGRKNFCAVGSVKSNIGHLDTAAGVAGLIKTALALHHKQLPPSLHFESPNPKIDFANSPFYVNAKLAEWQNGATPRRAGVSSFGIGGTNAHVVLEEAPAAKPFGDSRPAQLLVLSAKTESALDKATANVAEHLKQHSELNLADVAYTLQAGRREFAHRRMLVCRDAADAVAALASRDAKRISSRVPESDNPPVVFMFPGQGAQYVNMARDIYETEAVFREEVDTCAEILKPHLAIDLREVLYPQPDNTNPIHRQDKSVLHMQHESVPNLARQAAEKVAEAAWTNGKLQAAQAQLKQTNITQPALFVVEYALARLWMNWGVQPEAMIGHSIGEYVAACFAGVFSLEDALKLIAARGRMMQEMPAGTMLAVHLPEREVEPLLGDNLWLSAVNGAGLCVLSGSTNAVEELQKQLTERSVACTPLQTSHAFHSAMMEPILAPFTDLVRSVKPGAPEIPFISNVTGTWITAEQATAPSYWARHLRQTVRFANGIGELLKVPERILLEVGPGQTLSNLAKQHPRKNGKTVSVSSLRRASDFSSDMETLLAALGQLWLSGVRVDWGGFYAPEQRRRVRLPTYPFERKRYWVEPVRPQAPPALETERRATALDANGHGAERALEISVTSSGIVETAARRGNGAPQTRKERIILELRALLTNLSGMDLAGMSDTSTFTEMGFESLFLTQASLAIEKKMGVRIAFRQLLEEANSLDGLATCIANQLPPETPAEAPWAPRAEVPSHSLGEVRLPSGRANDHGSAKVAPSLGPAFAERPAESRSEAVHSSSVRETRRLMVSLDDELQKLHQEEQRLKQSITVKDLKSYPGLEQGLNELCSAYVCDYFKSCGITVEAGRRYSKAELKAALQLRPAYEQFLNFMLTVLAEDGIIRLSEHEIEGLSKAQGLPDSGALRARLLQQYPPFKGLLEMLQHCAAHYRQALAGDIPGISVLLPDGRHNFLKERLQAYTDQHKYVRFYEQVARELVLDLSRKTPLRILEVGAGGGDLTWQLVPALAGRGCEYYFTDIGRTFVQDARREAERRGLDFMRFGVLDISKDPLRQGFEANSFHVVLGLNVVHATSDVGETVGQLKKLLVPGGLIGLVEQTKHWRWDNMIIGLADGWWFFDDAFRKDSPLLDLDRWEEVFRQCGIAAVSALPSEPTDRAASNAGLILAQWEPPRAKHRSADFESAVAQISNVRGAANATTSEPVTSAAECNTAARVLAMHRSSAIQQIENLRYEVPLTPAQKEIWFASQMGDGASCAYNDSRLLQLRGRLKSTALHRALQKVVDRHEALRTIFSPRGDVQYILPQMKVNLPLVDFSELNQARREAELQALETKEANQPFDLVRGPLLRAELVSLAAEDHVLFLTIHHIVCDGHSWGILLHDLAELYSAECHGVPPQLGTPLQLSEFAREQARRQTTPEQAAAEAFWVKQFSDGAPVLELPADRPRPSAWTFGSGRQCQLLNSSLWKEIKRVSAQHDCTLFTTLLAAHYVFLHRLTGQADIVIGVPVADRTMAESDTLVGHCVNFLPVRVRIAEAAGFVNFLAEVKKAFLAAYEHRDVTFGSLIQKLNLSRDQSRMPLVSVTFNLDRLGGSLLFPGLETEVAPNSQGFSSFDLNLSVTEIAGEPRLDCRYSTALFSPETMRRWVAHLRTLLEGIAADPNRPISELPLLTSAERQQVAVDWNDTATEYERNACIQELFESASAKRPDSIALAFGGEQMAYAELNRRANRLAHRLQKFGVGPDKLVGLSVERSFEMVVAILAILKAGGAYVPLDRAYPRERLAFMLEDAAVPVLVTDGSFDLSALPSDKPPRVLRLDAEAAALANESELNPRSETTSENLAYVIYTSGSTGQPKGVSVPHRGVIRLVRNTNYLTFSPEDVFLQLAPISFDASTLEIWGPLLNGGRLVIFPPHVPSLEELGRALREEKITTLWLTAGLFHQMVDQQIENLRGVRNLLAGGDVLSVPHVSKALHELPDTQIINGYGPTENTTFTCCCRLPKTWSGGLSVSIGKPISNTQVYVLDANLAPVPLGVPGELYIGGDGLAREYLNRPTLTAERFIPNPFDRNTLPGRLYRTGDLVRWLGDGNLEFLGRTDEQVKVRGFRVELGEVEAALRTHPSVSEAAVITREDKSGSKHLIAYVAPHSGAAVDRGELRSWLEQKLPAYMLPAHYVALAELPLTANGKVDRRALPTPESLSVATTRAITAPRNALEKRLLEIWSELLERNHLSVEDNFFHLGGHSLLATQLVSRIGIVFGIELPVRCVFENPSIAGLSAAIQGRQSASGLETTRISRRLDAARAEELLAHLDQLSEAEMEQLLNSPELQQVTS